MLILASASPRRRELLIQAGVEFIVDAANIPEDLLPGELAMSYVARIAEQKARAVFNKREPIGASTVVLGADTCVLLDNSIMGKPCDYKEARAMLESLSARTHEVLTGIAVVTSSSVFTAVEISQVTFDPIPAAEMEHYLATEEPFDKAGAYGIQGYAARWIPRIEGCYFNVVGLPIARTMKLLASTTSDHRG